MRLALLGACLLALFWILRRTDPKAVWAVAVRADGGWLALSLLPLAVRFLIWGHKWRRILARREPVPFVPALRILMAGSFVNLVTPTAKIAGGFVRALLLHRRRGWPVVEAYGSALHDQITNVLGNVLLFGVVGLCAPFGLDRGPLRSWTLLAGGIACVLVVSGVGLRNAAWRLVRRPAVGRLIHGSIPERFREPNSESDDLLARLLTPLLNAGTRRSTLVPDLVWSAASVASICLANAMVLRAVGADLPLVLAFLAILVGYFAGVASGIGGGIGITEAALTALYVQFGIESQIALAGALVHRALLYSVLLLGGGAAMMAEGRRIGSSGR